MVKWALLNTASGTVKWHRLLESSLMIFIFFDMIMSPLRIYFKTIIKYRPILLHRIPPTGESLKIFRDGE